MTTEKPDYQFAYEAVCKENVRLRKFYDAFVAMMEAYQAIYDREHEYDE